MTGFYSSYANSNISSSSAASVDVTPSVDIEASIRLRAIFSLTLTWVQFQNPDPNNNSQFQDDLSGFGLGMKIDLPGFFFMGGGNDELERAMKKSPLNTYIFGEVLKLTVTTPSTGGATTTSAGRGGIGCDIFPYFQHTYLSIRFALLNLLGVSYASYAVGVGFRF